MRTLWANLFQWKWNTPGTEGLSPFEPQRRRKGRVRQKVFEKIVPKDFSKLTRDIKPHIQEVQILQEQYVQRKVY